MRHDFIPYAIRLRAASLCAVLCLLVLSFAGCSDSPLTPDAPVTLTFWHVYGAQARSPMNRLIEQFNQTVGKKHGVIISVTSVSNSSAIHDALVASAHKEPGSGDVPDIFTCYPKTLAAMGNGVAMDWGKYFSAEELKAYVPQFLEEGKIDGALKIFPVTKSTNALFINATIFDRFSEDTGVTYADLATWEGFFRAATRYHAWSRGKAFFMHDDWIHYPMLNMLARGEPFLEGSRIRWESPALREIWRPLAKAASGGHVCLMKGYATKAMMTGESVCGIESTASILYFKDTVTLSDNTTSPLRLAVLPEPRFAGAKRLDVQRGVGLCARASTPEKEYAAALFCKWLTAPENNLPFVIQGGYMPVRHDTFQKLATGEGVNFPNDTYRALYRVLATLHAESEFVTQPSFPEYGAMEKQFSAALIAVLGSTATGGHGSMLEAIQTASPRACSPK